MFVVLFGFIPNSDVVQSLGYGAQTELADLLDRASERVEEYRLLFKDLTAEETKSEEEKKTIAGKEKPLQHD